MTMTQLRRLHRAEPFVPFRLRLKGGTEVSVGKPTILAHGGGGSLFAVFAGPDEFRLVRRSEVMSVEVVREL